MEILDVVRLTVALPEDGLEAGAEGTVVDIFTTPETAYEVEFTDGNGRTVAMATVNPDQVVASPAD